MKRTMVLAVLAVVLLGLAGCGSWSKESTHEEELCDSLSKFDKAVTDLAALPPDANQTRVQRAQEEVNKAWDQVKDDAEDVHNANVQAITDAYNQVQAAIKAAQTQGLAAAQPQINDAAASVNKARTQYNQSVNC